MTALRATLPLAGALLLAGCGGTGEPAPETGSTNPAPAETAPSPPPPQVTDFPVLSSKDCAEVLQFYLEAIGGHDFARAALVWNDPAIDSARLEEAYGPYGMPQFEWAEPEIEGAAGSLYCTVKGTLTDAEDSARPPIEGGFLLRRVNDVDGATPDQLRWTLRSSTFVENLDAGPQGEP